jgi:hypothetical protein
VTARKLDALDRMEATLVVEELLDAHVEWVSDFTDAEPRDAARAFLESLETRLEARGFEIVRKR